MPIKNTIIHLNEDLKFLIACCQINPSEDDINFIFSYLNANAEHSELNALISLANQHGVLPLVYKTIKNLSESYNSGSSLNATHFKLNAVLSELKPFYMSIVQKNMLMTSELIKIMDLLRENHIEALAFKGPTLAQQAYGDITLRQYSDLDILVDEDDALEAGTLMTQNGHTALLPLKILSNKTCLHTAKDFSLLSETSGVHTELHWQLFEKRYNILLVSCAVGKKCQTVKINTHEIKTLRNELLLVYLCLHGIKHSFERIEWICDIDRLIRCSNVNWDEAIAIAERSHVKRSFYLGLSLAYHLLHTKLPQDILCNIDTEDIKMLHVMTEKQMSEKNSERSDLKRIVDDFFYQIKLYDHKNDMIRFYLSTLFNISANDCQTYILPKNLKFLYLILRPIRLISRHIHRFFVRRRT